jgi:hypothetical protein
MAQPKTYFEFDVVMWDDSGNKLLLKKRVSIQRQSLNSARNVMDKKFKMSEGYFYELNKHYTK